MKGTLGLLHSNPVLDLPIIIGSYPIQDNINASVQIGYPHPHPQPQSKQPQVQPYPQPYVAQVQPPLAPTFDYGSNSLEKDLGSHQPTAPPQMPDQHIYPSLASSMNPGVANGAYPYPYTHDGRFHNVHNLIFEPNFTLDC